jgi:tetratricopeptide (TPR) repeat protein
MNVAMEHEQPGDKVTILEDRLAAAQDEAERAGLLFQTGIKLVGTDPARANQLLREAIGMAHRRGEQRTMATYALKAAEAMLAAARIEDATAFRQFIIEAAELPGDRRIYYHGSYEYVGGEIDYALGDYEQARKHFEAARRHWREQGPADAEHALLTMLANIAGLQGDLSLALSYHQQAYALSEELNDIALKVHTTYNLGWTLESLGRWGDAADCFYRVLGDKNIEGRKQMIGDTYNCLGELYLHRNLLGKAIDFFRRAYDELQDQSPYGSARDDSLCNLGHAFHRQGNFDGALEAYKKALDRSRASGDRRLQAILRWRLAELQVDRRDIGAAAQLCDESLALARGLGARSVEADARRVWGRIRVARGELDQARACFEEAVSLLADAEESYELAMARHQYGRFLLDQGQKDRASEMLEAAGRGFRKLRVVAEAEQVNRLLFQIAIDERPEEALLDGLAGLAAIGLEPAEFISEALNLMLEAFRFEYGLVLAQGKVITVQGRPEIGRAQLLRPLELVNTPTVLSWPVLTGNRAVGRIYLERRTGLQAPGGALVFEAVSRLLAEPFSRLLADVPAST